MPMGLFSLAGEVENDGWNTKIVNIPLELALDRGVTLRKLLRSFEAEIYAIDLHWAIHSAGAIQTAQQCKTSHPDCLVVLGGMTADYFSEEILRAHTSVDVIVKGEAEQVLPELVGRYLRHRELGEIRGADYREEHRVIHNSGRQPLQDLDELDFTNLSLLHHKDEYVRSDIFGYRRFGPKTPSAIWLPIARGCVYDCIHCGGSLRCYSAFSGRPNPIFRSPQKIAEDIERLDENHIDIMQFSHDPEIGGENYYRDIVEQVKKRGVDTSVYIEAFQSPSEGFFRRTADSFHDPTIALSPESPSDEVRYLVGKRFSNQDLLRTLKAADDHLVSTLVYFCLGLPGETRESLGIFDDLVRRILRTTVNARVIPPISYVIDPNCQMAIDSKKYAIDLIYRCFEDYRQMSLRTGSSSVVNPGYRTDHLSDRDIVELTNRCQDSVVYLNRLKKTGLLFKS